MTSARTMHWLGILAVLVAFYGVTYSYRAITDTTLNSLQTRAFVLHGDLDLARYSDWPSSEISFRDGHVYSIYGFGISLIAAPVYAVLVRLDANDHVLQGAVGVLAVAVAVVLMFRLLLGLAPPALAAAGTLVFGFGTTMWTVASMGLFQQGPVALFECLGMAGLFSRRPRAPALAGFGFAAATFIRPMAVIPLVLVGLFYLLHGTRPAGAYALGAVAPLAAILVQNRWVWGGWLTGGYSHASIGWNANVHRSFTGLLFGWWRGLFVYSPVLAVGFAGWFMAMKRVRGFVESRLVVLGSSCVVTILVYTKWTAWWGGLNQFGYRLLLEMVPFLVVLGVYAVVRAERLRPVAFMLGVVSILTMTWGAAPSRGGFDGELFARRIVDTSLGQSWIVFLDHLGTSLLRLGGVAAVGALMYVFARAHAAAEPAFSREAIAG